MNKNSECQICPLSINKNFEKKMVTVLKNWGIKITGSWGKKKKEKKLMLIPAF